jgi:hypothetical protein
VANGHAVAAELATRPAAWLTAFAQAQRPDRFEGLAARLDAALPILLADRNVKALFAIRCTLDELAAAGARRPDFQVARAQRQQRAFDEPAFLSALAEAMLAQDRPPREFSELALRIAGPATYALYSARLKLSEQPSVRRRFVLMIREFGTDALPMIRAGLVRLETRREAPVAALLAADLFLASPRVRDEEAGAVSARYLHDSPPGLADLALEALVAFWGPRAAPLLIELVGSPDEGVSLSAINGLRELSSIDDLAVLRIASAVRLSNSADVRAAGRAALLATSGKAHVVALRALKQLG